MQESEGQGTEEPWVPKPNKRSWLWLEPSLSFNSEVMLQDVDGEEGWAILQVSSGDCFRPPLLKNLCELHT